MTREHLKKYVINELKEGRAVSTLSKETGLSRDIIYRWQRYPKTAPNGGQWSEEENKILKENYPSLDKEELLQILPDRSWKSIQVRAHRMKIGRIAPRNYENIIDLETVDTEEKAYVIGFIAADGCVYQGTQGQKRLSIRLSMLDEDHVIKLRQILCPNVTLTYSAGCCGFSIIDDILCDQLHTYNIFPRKSLVLQPPLTIPEEFVSVWVRGYFDGDGCVSIYQGKISVIIAGTVAVLTWINNKFKTYYHHQVNVYHRKPKCPVVNYASCTALEFLSWIYGDSNIYLERKFRKYKEFQRCPKIDARPKWTNKEEDFLLTNMINYNRKELASLLGRSPGAIDQKIKRLLHLRG